MIGQIIQLANAADSLLYDLTQLPADEYGMNDTGFNVGWSAEGVGRSIQGLTEELPAGVKSRMSKKDRRLYNASNVGGILSPPVTFQSALNVGLAEHILKKYINKPQTTIRRIQNAPMSDVGKRSGAYAYTTTQKEIVKDPEMIEYMGRRKAAGDIQKETINSIVNLGNMGGLGGLSGGTDIMSGGLPFQKEASYVPYSPAKVDAIKFNMDEFNKMFSEWPAESSSGYMNRDEMSQDMYGHQQWGLPEFQEGGRVEEEMPVEAEGGEYLITYDDQFNVRNIEPLKGPKHRSGGIKMTLEPNQAILNTEQFDELQDGTPLSEILRKVPMAYEAQGGTARPEPIERMTPITQAVLGEVTPEGFVEDPLKTISEQMLTENYPVYAPEELPYWKGKRSMKFGANEMELLANELGNLFAVVKNAQKPEDIRIERPQVGEPVLASPARINEEPYLRMIKTGINTGITNLRRTGNLPYLPSLISEGITGAEKVAGSVGAENVRSANEIAARNAAISSEFIRAQDELFSRYGSMRMQADLAQAEAQARKDVALADAMYKGMLAPALYKRATKYETREDEEYYRRLKREEEAYKMEIALMNQLMINLQKAGYK